MVVTAGGSIQRAEIISSTIRHLNAEVHLYVSESLIYFAGHFPDFPILPGVVQLDWAVSYAKEFLAFSSPVLSVERLKFTCPIRPAAQVTLSIEASTDRRHVNFRFYHERLVFSQGRLVYE